MLSTQRQKDKNKFVADNLLRSEDFDRKKNSKKATSTHIQMLALFIKLRLIKSMNKLEVVKNMNQIFTDLLH